MEMTSITILALITIYGLLLFIGHIAMMRLINNSNYQGSKQKQFIKLAFLMLLLFVMSVALSSQLKLIDLVYLSVMCAFEGYFLFHIFNLSQTGRRVRLLIDLYENNSPTDHKPYTNNEIVHKRIDRLIAMGQITCDDGKLNIKSSNFLMIGYFMIFFKKLFFPKT